MLARRGKMVRNLVVAAILLSIVLAIATVAVIAQMTAGVLGASHAVANCPDDEFTAQASENYDDLTPVQLRHAVTVVNTGRSRAQSDYAIVIALAVTAQESRFLNFANDGTGQLEPEQRGVEASLSYPHDAVGNDHGSLGIMQQQYPWWGTIAELMDPATAATKFYAALNDVPGWEEMTVAEAAQAVQRSAFPNAYAQWETLAREILARVEGDDPGSILCGPGDAMTCPPTGSSAELGLTPDALRVLRCVDLYFGEHTYHGVGDRPNESDHPSGRAVDVMIDDWETAAGNDHGWEIAEWVQQNYTQLGVKYVIFDAEIWSDDRSDEGWRPYEHPSGATDPNSLHRNHVHVSVYGDAAGGGVTDGEWSLPLQPGTYHLSSGYGPRYNPTDGGTEFHTGLDFAAAAGTPVSAASSGEVTQAGPIGNYGNLVIIRTGNIDHYYAHLATVNMITGWQVPAGQFVGTVGSTGRSTGPHLHFEIRIDGSTTDPLTFLRRNGADSGELP
jgi:hypothetical protein